MIYTTKKGGNASGWPWLKYFLKAESRHFSSLHGPLTSCKKSEKTYENFCDGLTDRCDKTQYVSSKMRERTMFFGGSLVVLHNNDSVFYRGGGYVAKYSLLWKDAVIRIVGSQGIFFGLNLYTLKIKKMSDALLKSDARADQNQVIFFTSPNINLFSSVW